MCDEIESEENDVEFETGPFCRHFGDPSDCDMLCKCGHKCYEHSIYSDYGCNIEDCNCEKFEDTESNE